MTPIWYVWEDGRFLLSLGKSRRHLRNIARDPHVTLCVDEDPLRGPELDELLWFEGRVGVEITPERWLAWDQGKG